MAQTINDLVYIDSTGYHYADYPSFLTWIKEQYQNIYGADVYLGNDSQDGQFLAVLAQAFYDTAALGAATYSSFSPVSGQGVGLSRLVKINGLARENPSFSTVDLDVGGISGTTITDGIAIDTLQQKWALPASVTIPFAGTVTVTATAVEQGAIAALPNSITSIFTPTQGWQTVNNPSAATIGAPIESDAQLRRRQKVSTANPSLTVFEGTLGAVGNVSGVSKSQGYENPTNAVDANGLPPHSIAMVVEGGLDSDVAQAIQVHKTPGTQTVGTTTVLVDDSHGMPIFIKFYRPDPAVIGVQVTITELEGWNPGYEAQIKAAVAAYVTAISIGGIVVLTQLYPVAYLVGTPAYGAFDIVSIELSYNAGPFGSANILLAFTEIPVCDPLTDVTVIT